MAMTAGAPVHRIVPAQAIAIWLLVVLCALVPKVVSGGSFTALLSESTVALGIPCVAGIICLSLLRMSGFFLALPIRSRHSQLLICLVTVVVCAAGADIAGEFAASHNMGSSFVANASNWFYLASAFVLYGVCLVCPSLRRVLTGHRKIVIDASSDEISRVRWYLAQSGLADEVELVDVETSGLNGAFDGVRLAVVSRERAEMAESSLPLVTAYLAGVPVVDVDGLVAALEQRIDLSRIDLFSLLVSAPRVSLRRRMYQAAKALVEPVMALIMAVILLPLVALIAAVVKFSSPGPIFYRQVRSGLRGHPFVLWKFRTMHTDAEASGPQWASPDDSRTTRVGEFLRATRLDELPQLLNVMRGELSFIGPRPERPEIVQRLILDIPGFPLRTAMRPGITGWAQVRAGYAASVDACRTKLEYDLYYFLNASLALDIEILFRTLAVVVTASPEAPKRPKIEPHAAILVPAGSYWSTGEPVLDGRLQPASTLTTVILLDGDTVTAPSTDDPVSMMPR